MNNLVGLGFAVLSCCVIAGCGDAVDTASLSGMVLVAGEPMGKGVLNFYPAGGDRPIGAAVSSSGEYKVVLPQGDYTVVVMASTVLPAGWKEGDPVPPPKVTIPQQYTQRRSSPLAISVADDNMTHDFEVAG